MKQQQIIEAIDALAAVVDANRGLMGSESTQRVANDKLKQLIPLLNPKTS